MAARRETTKNTAKRSENGSNDSRCKWPSRGPAGPARDAPPAASSWAWARCRLDSLARVRTSKTAAATCTESIPGPAGISIANGSSGRIGEDDRPTELGLLFVANRMRNADGSERSFIAAYEVWPGAADTDRGRAALGSMGPDVGLFRYGDMSQCVHLVTGRHIAPNIVDGMLPQYPVIAYLRPEAWERGGEGER